MPKTQQFIPDFLVIPTVLVQDKELQQLDYLVYGVVYWYEHLKDGRCKAKNETLAGILRASPSSIAHSLIRLEENRYIIRIFKDKNKRIRQEIKTLVKFSRFAPQSIPDKPTEQTQDSSTEQQNKNNINKNTEDGDGQAVAAVFKIFESVNPSIKRMYGNTTQRKSAENLIKQYGLNKILKAATAAVECLGQPYAPNISTPYQLETRWADLVAYYMKEKNKKGGVML